MENWKMHFDSRLPVLGHRNWIIVADMAYPEQSAPAIETIYTGSDHLRVVKTVLESIGKAPHVKPVIYVDGELKFLSEKDAPGIENFRKDLYHIFGNTEINSVLHDEFFPKLDEASKLFSILILKTDMVLPYTSVFFQLECGYWDEDREKRLRDAVRKS